MGSRPPVRRVSRALPARKYVPGILTLAIATYFAYWMWRVVRSLGRVNHGDPVRINVPLLLLFGVFLLVLFVAGLRYVAVAVRTPADSHWSFDLGGVGSCVFGLSVLAGASGAPIEVTLPLFVVGVVGTVAGLIGTVTIDVDGEDSPRGTATRPGR